MQKKTPRHFEVAIPLRNSCGDWFSVLDFQSVRVGLVEIEALGAELSQ
jgi:hypothetical protein